MGLGAKEDLEAFMRIASWGPFCLAGQSCRSFWVPSGSFSSLLRVSQGILGSLLGFLGHLARCLGRFSWPFRDFIRSQNALKEFVRGPKGMDKALRTLPDCTDSQCEGIAQTLQGSV